NPLHTRIFHPYPWIEPFSHSMTNERRALLGEQLDQSFLFGDQGVDIVSFTVEKRGDGALFADRRHQHKKVVYVVKTQSILRSTIQQKGKLFLPDLRHETISKP